jgi:hypothetical protein
MALLAGYLVMSMVDNLFTSLLINYPMWIMGGVVRGYYERAVYEGENDKLTGNASIELAPAETR